MATDIAMPAQPPPPEARARPRSGASRSGRGPVHRHTLADQVVDYVRDRISENIYKPGQKLTIQGLAAELDISMTPVREAIKTLAAMRLIEVEVNKRIVIARPDTEEVRQLLVVYNNLERLAAEVVVEEASDAQIGELDAIARRCSEAVAANDRLGYFHSNQEFHLALVRISNNDPLIEIHQNLNSRLYPFRFRGMNDQDSHWVELSREHHMIVDALRGRDAALASQLIKQHARRTRDNINRMLAEQG